MPSPTESALQFTVVFVLFHALLLGLLLRTARAPETTHVDWWLRLASLLLLTAFLFLAWPWGITGYFIRIVWPVALTLALIRAYSTKIRRRAWNRDHTLLESAAVILSLAIVVSMNIAALSEFQPRGRTIALAFPLRSGTYYVLNGGSGPLLNGHNTFPWEHVVFDLNGARYGVDFIRLNDTGTSGAVWRDDLEDYEIYGDPIFSPCTGRVVQLRDDLPDRLPPARNDKQPAGNYVLMECEGIQILLAHLRNGSLAVSSGERIDTGTFLGRVGNSGNSSEPHLHLHAAVGASAEYFWLDGDPVSILIGGRLLIRNDLVLRP